MSMEKKIQNSNKNRTKSFKKIVKNELNLGRKGGDILNRNA